MNKILERIINYLERLDLSLLDGVFQPIADWLQDLTNKNCFFFARATVFFHYVIMLFQISTGKVLDLSDLVQLGIYLCLSIFALNHITSIEAQQPRNHVQQNPARMTDADIRKMTVPLIIVFIFIIDKKESWAYYFCSQFRHLLIVVVIYLMSCTPHREPPKQRRPKMRKTKRSAWSLFQPLPDPS